MNDTVEYMAWMMKQYDHENDGKKTWRDLAQVAYDAYQRYQKFESTVGDIDADISSRG